MKPFGLLVFCFIFAFADAEEGAPSAKPRNVKVETTSESSLRVTWEAPSKSDWNGDISGYIIIYKYILDQNYQSDDLDETSTCTSESCSFELTGLDTFAEYSIGVKAFNSLDYGPMSDRVNQKTAEGTPGWSEYDTHVECKALSSEELFISWNNVPSYQLNGIFKNYKVSYAPTDLFDDKERREHKITTVNHVVLTGLKTSTNYAFKLSVSNTVRDSNESPTYYCATERRVPSEPIDVKVIVYGTEKVLVLWNEPLSQESVDSEQVLHYTIYYAKKGSKAKKGEVLAPQTSYEIFGLEANESYDIWVTAESKIGKGLPSEDITVTINNQTAAKIAAINSTFTVQFKKDVMLPCDAIGFPNPTLIWKVNGDNLSSNERLQILANGTLFIQNVIREDANNYTCIAENAFGNDSVTHQLIVRAPPRAPEVTVLSTTTDEISLQLKPNRSDSEPVYVYEVFYKLDSDIEKWQSERVSRTQFFNIPNCNCGSTYLIYAFGYNDYDSWIPGDNSDILTVRTNGSEPNAPKSSDFLETSVDKVTLHLSSWKADSCPILYLFVAYKEKKNTRWINIRRKLRPSSDFVLNLKPATAYDIRVIAHNSAGFTKAYYEVETLTELGTIAPASNINEVSDA